MKSFEEMFNNLIKTMEEKEEAMTKQIQEAKELEAEIEEMENTLMYLDAMKAQLLEEKKQKVNELKQLRKNMGGLDTTKIEAKEPEPIKVEVKENIPEIPQLIEHKPIKKRPRRTVRK